MQSWKNNLTTQLSNPGIFVGKGTDRYTNVTSRDITHLESTLSVTFGLNARTKKVDMIDYKLLSGEAVKDIHAWLNSYRTTTLSGQAHAIAGTEPEVLTPSESPSSPVPTPDSQRLGDPHE